MRRFPRGLPIDRYGVAIDRLEATIDRHRLCPICCLGADRSAKDGERSAELLPKLVLCAIDRLHLRDRSAELRVSFLNFFKTILNELKVLQLSLTLTYTLFNKKLHDN